MHYPNEEFGVYIKTFRPDYHLAKALVASLRHFVPDLPIMLVPDDGYRKHLLWREKSLVLDDPFLAALDGYYKKLWVFFGPYRRFIYLDADMLALRDLRPIIDRVLQTESPFFIVCAEAKVRKRLADGSEQDRAALYTNHIGDLGLLQEYDPAYQWAASFPFNSGFFASCRDVFDHEKLRERLAAAQAFQADRGLPPLTTTRQGLFMSDQGFLNYMVAKYGPRLELLNDFFIWGGRPIPGVDGPPDGDPDGGFRRVFVHWAGCPRPSIMNQEVPAGRLWRKYYQDYHREYSTTSELLRCKSRQIRRALYDKGKVVLQQARGAVQLGSTANIE